MWFSKVHLYALLLRFLRFLQILFRLLDKIFSVISNNVNCTQGCRSFLSIVGDNLRFYPNFALFSTMEEMNLDHEFFQVPVIKLSEDHKNRKRSSPKMEDFFSPYSSEDQKTAPNTIQRSGVIQSQIRGRMQMQAIVKLFGGYIPQTPGCTTTTR